MLPYTGGKQQQDPKEIAVQTIIIEKLPDITSDVEEVTYHTCDFCGKSMGISHDVRRWIMKMSGGNEVYCAFCLRHRHNTKFAKENILPMSFRGLIGFYYYEKYAYATKRSITISEIEDMIQTHADIGLQNPVFNYDFSNFIWHIDFSRVGKTKKKIKIRDVMKTIVNMLICFNVHDYLAQADIQDYTNKINEAIQKFYSDRYRPEGVRLLIPTINLPAGAKTTKEELKLFTPDDIFVRS